MSLANNLPINPPVDTDKQLVDYSGILQRNFARLFLAAHTHVGAKGVLSAAPTSNQGSIGDLLIGQVSGSVYLYVKVTDTTWFRFGPATAI